MLSGGRGCEHVPKYFTVRWLFDALYAMDKFACLINLVRELVIVH